MRAVFTALALSLAAPAASEEWRPVDAETGQIRDLDGLEALAGAFPDSGSVRLRLLQAQIGDGDVEAVLASLKWLQERGYVFSEGAQAQIPQLVGEEHAEAARAILIPQAEVIEASEVVAEVPASAGLVESVSAATAEWMTVTSVTENGAWMRLGEDEWLKLPIENANDMSGIVTSHNGTIGWIASSNIDGSDDNQGRFNGLIGIDGSFQTPILIAAGQGVSLSDLSVGVLGTIFASDPIGGGVYRASRSSSEVEILVQPGTFRSPQGSAVSADGTKLYISDYRYGLAIIDLASGDVSRLTSDVPVLLDGVDGLWRHGNELIAVQNGTSPMRISAFTLSDDGTRITAARILEQAHSGWTEPLGGSISGDALVYVATGQWDRYDKGSLREGMEAIPTQIRRLPLSSEPD